MNRLIKIIAVTILAASIIFAYSCAESAIGINPAVNDFALTRVFINNPWNVSIRLLSESNWGKDGFIQEATPQLALGLPHGFQFSIHDVIEYDGSSVVQGSFVPELRFAFSKYKKIIMNPVLGLSFSLENGGPNTLRLIFQLSQPFNNDKLLWATNFLYEQKTGSPRETEYILYNGLRYEMANFEIGAEFKTEYSTSKDLGYDPFGEVLIGPSAGYRFNDKVAIKLNSIIGLTTKSPHDETNLFFVYSF